LRKKNEDEPVFEFFYVQRIGNNILHFMKKQVLGDCEILKVFVAIHG
jgi:hypothetical protein